MNFYQNWDCLTLDAIQIVGTPKYLLLSLRPLTDKFNIVSNDQGRTQRCSFPFYLGKSWSLVL